MQKNRIFEMTDEYFDGRLSKEDEVLLFTAIASDENARGYFKQMHILKMAVKSAEEEYPEALDRKVLQSLKPNTAPRIDINRIVTYTTSAAAVLLIAITFFIYGEVREYRAKLSELDTKVKEQYNTIEMLYNSLPTVTVKPVMNN